RGKTRFPSHRQVNHQRQQKSHAQEKGKVAENAPDFVVTGWNRGRVGKSVCFHSMPLSKLTLNGSSWRLPRSAMRARSKSLFSASQSTGKLQGARRFGMLSHNRLQEKAAARDTKVLISHKEHKGHKEKEP